MASSAVFSGLGPFRYLSSQANTHNWAYSPNMLPHFTQAVRTCVGAVAFSVPQERPRHAGAPPAGGLGVGLERALEHRHEFVEEVFQRLLI